MLPLEALDALIDNLIDFRFDECIVTCPNPFSHPKIGVVLTKAQELCDAVDVFLPISGLKNVVQSGQLKRISDRASAFIILVDSQKPPVLWN